MGVGIDFPALMEEHFSVAAFPSADEDDERMFPSKVLNVAYSVSYLSADGVE